MKGSLRELHMGRCLGLRLIEACHVLGDLPNLRGLHLEDVWEMGRVLPRSAWRGGPSFLLSLASLSLTDYGGSDQNLGRFLMLVPAKLEHFSFIGGTDVDSEHHSSLTLPFLASALSPHMETLRTLVVNTFYVSSPTHVDLSGFKRLMELTLSLSTTGTACCATAGILTAPSIYKFRWVISDDYHLDLLGFGGAEEDWLRRVARAAVAQRSSLREMEVSWRPTRVYRRFHSGGKPEIYPWDRLENLQGELLQGGRSSIRLSWSSPSIPRDALHLTQRKIRELEMRGGFS
ncbi:hypothetical protein B0T25DRAFT_248460 [Lasiosphaeria hispida]|uniref:Uncharacterized protein n=1 Tax=Lasiosphaeria hispida TaxID=260671 RepID=A0AAJ0HF91_9PEZI|nr:hypothetical protein B0T25DRAFT_248460 [Lasiosphaeria hispida]